MASNEQRAMIAELAAEIPPHLRRVQAASQSLHGPAREALDHYAAAGVQVVLELQRERLEVRRV
jgi:hypothetical protein